jgi:hypothetical protein
MLDIFALIVLVVIVATTIFIFVTIGRIPGDVARNAGHPQADAINLLGWFGLLAGGVGWVVALIWSKTRPLAVDTAALEARLSALEQRLADLEGDGQ